MPETTTGGNEPFKGLLTKTRELHEMLDDEPNVETLRAQAIRGEIKRRQEAGSRFVWQSGDVVITHRPGDEKQKGDGNINPGR